MNEITGFAKFYKIFGIVVVILIIILGFSVLFLSYFRSIPSNIRIILAIFIISYGAYRLVNIWNKSKKGKDEKDSD